MKFLDFKDIFNRLQKWKKDRHLSTLEQYEGLLPNILEEVVEYIRAKDEYEEIDALCDIIVFSINANSDLEDMDLESFDDKVYTDYSNFENIPYLNQNYERIATLIPLLAIIEGDNTAQIIYECIEEIENKGYDSYQCMLETIKEISSRTGVYDEKAKKWIKDTSEEAKARWYKADYSKCRKK